MLKLRGDRMKKFIVFILLLAIGAGAFYIWPILDQEDEAWLLIQGIFNLTINSESYAYLDDESNRILTAKYKNEKPLEAYMSKLGWEFREQMGSGYVFSRAGLDVVVESSSYVKGFIIWQLPEETTFELGFYLVKNNSEDSLSTLDLNNVDGDLMFTEKDILSYNWSSHEIKFKQNFLEYLQENKENKRENGLLVPSGGSEYFHSDQRDYFVVKLNGEALYSGHFEQSDLSSYYVPSIKLIDTQSGVILKKIETEYDIIDNRNNDKIKEFMSQKELL
jgi:hypothetical protein